jgi:hypothetical protein
MIKAHIRFNDAYGDGLIEQVEYVTELPALLPIDSALFIPSWCGERFMFDIKQYWYDEKTKSLIVRVFDRDHDGYAFQPYDIEGLIESGWSYVKNEN